MAALGVATLVVACGSSGCRDDQADIEAEKAEEDDDESGSKASKRSDDDGKKKRKKKSRKKKSKKSKKSKKLKDGDIDVSDLPASCQQLKQCIDAVVVQYPSSARETMRAANYAVFKNLDKPGVDADRNCLMMLPSNGCIDHCKEAADVSDLPPSCAKLQRCIAKAAPADLTGTDRASHLCGAHAVFVVAKKPDADADALCKQMLPGYPNCR